MNTEVRRKDRQLSDEEALALLKNGEYGILSTIGENGYPYGVPISYAYDDGTLYFHGVNGIGHKFENLIFSSKVCFTLVGNTQVLPDKFSTNYESVVVCGTVKQAENKFTGLEKLVQKYSAGFEEKGKQYAAGSLEKVAVYEMQIEQITGKARR